MEEFEEFGNVAYERLTNTKVTYEEGERVQVTYPDGRIKSFAPSTFQCQFRLPGRRKHAIYTSPNEVNANTNNGVAGPQILKLLPKEITEMNFDAFWLEILEKVPTDIPCPLSSTAAEKLYHSYVNRFQLLQGTIASDLNVYKHLSTQYFDYNITSLLGSMNNSLEVLKRKIVQTGVAFIRAKGLEANYCELQLKEIEFIRTQPKIEFGLSLLKKMHRSGMAGRPLGS